MLAMRSCVHGPGVDSGELIADGQWENVDTGRKISSHCRLKIWCVFSKRRVVILQNVVMFLKWSQLGVIVISLLNDSTVITWTYLFDTTTMSCMTLFQCGKKTVWIWDMCDKMTVWQCCYVTKWLYDNVATMWWDDCVTTLLCNEMTLCDKMTVWQCCYVMRWLCDRPAVHFQYTELSLWPQKPGTS